MVEEIEELDPTEHPEIGALRVLGRELESAQEVLAAICAGANVRRSPSAEEIYAESMLYLIEVLRSFLLGYEDSLRRLAEWRRREPPDPSEPNADEIPF